MNLKEALIAYADKFGENFPIRLVDLEETEIIEVIQGCIEKNEPYTPEDDDPDIDY